MLPCDPTADETDTRYKGFFRRSTLQKHSKVIQMVGSIHSDICNVPALLLPGVRVQVKLTKVKPEFYVMNKDSDSKVTFKFLDAQLLVKRVKSNPAIPAAHNKALMQGHSRSITCREWKSRPSLTLAVRSHYL
jgi:hypothetical protein